MADPLNSVQKASRFNNSSDERDRLERVSLLQKNASSNASNPLTRSQPLTEVILLVILSFLALSASFLAGHIRGVPLEIAQGSLHFPKDSATFLGHRVTLRK